ncbi:MAG TPA: DUF1800 domain-containing protein [Longimicrobiales bacterium]|nr:DUF1800 domain-containing protein [Longimicrobiales bacterium]
MSDDLDDVAHQAEPTPARAADLPTSRRALFAAAAAAGVALLARPETAQAQRVVRPHISRPQPPDAPGDSLLRLVSRITNGVTDQEMTLARRLGFNGYLNYHLRHTTINDNEAAAFVAARFPNLQLAGTGLYQQEQNPLLNQLAEATLYRAVYSKRQLYERMVHFWSDHFNIYYPKVNYLKLLDDRLVIRRHALGRFPDLLRASAHSAAMLEYLDNTRSRGRNVNQNYARELMELHTMGADGGYTQTDVEEVTRCLTGWTIQGRGNFFFDASGHDNTAKTVLGTPIPARTGAAGVQDGEQVLTMLLAHPSTARFISTKLIQWLLQYDPPPALVTRVAATFTRTGGDIPSMIRDILTPANLLAAPAKYKQPYQLVVSAMRATQARTINAAAISGGQLRIIGQPLFLWEDPDGYPDNVDWWAGLILQRWNFAGYLANLATGNTTVDVGPLMQGTMETRIETINRRVFGGYMPADLKQQLSAYLGVAPTSAARVRETLALALSSSAFQWY